MEQDEKKRASPGGSADWMISMADFWMSAAKAWSAGATEAAMSSPVLSAGDFSKMQEGWQALLNTWQRSSMALGELPPFCGEGVKQLQLMRGMLG